MPMGGTRRRGRRDARCLVKNRCPGTYTEAIVPIWNEEDAKACGEYTALTESADALTQKLVELGGDDHFNERRNKN